MRTYYPYPNFEIDVAKLVGQQPYTVESMYKKNMQVKGSNRSLASAKTYHFDLEKANELFDFLLESQHIQLPDPRHKIHSKEKLRGKGSLQMA